MEYIDQYNQFYSKYYLKVELLIKNFLIKYQNEKKTSNFSINLVSKCLNKYQENIFPNKEIEKLTQLFNLRYSIYQPNDSGEILKNELKKAFKEINLDEFQNYNYNKFIKELALHEVLNEISRLISNNYSLFDMMYKLNDFEKFEIKEYPNIGLENSTAFKELQNKLYPKNDEFENFEVQEEEYTNDIDLSYQLSILEIIMKIENWDDLSATKKGEVLQHLLGKNKDNIKKYYIELTKKPSDTKGKFYDKDGKYNKDKLKAQEVIKNILG